MRVNVADRVQVVRGRFDGATGIVEEVGAKLIAVRCAGTGGWPFGQLISVDRHDLVVVDRNEGVEEALL